MIKTNNCYNMASLQITIKQVDSLNIGNEVNQVTFVLIAF